MKHAQKYLAQANRHIAELTVRIVRQRAIVKPALDSGQRSEMAESLLDALEESLRIFWKHRIFLLGCDGSSALPSGDAATGRCHDAMGMERHDKDQVPTPTNGQQGKSPSSEAGARLKFDGSNNNGRPLSPQQRDF